MALKDRILTAILNTSAGEPFVSPLASQEKYSEELGDAIGEHPSGGGGSTTFDVTQASQPSGGFAVMDVLRLDEDISGDPEWILARADLEATLGTHVVVSVSSGDLFTLAQSGRFNVGAHGLVVREYYFLSVSSDGLLVLNEPVAGFSNPLVFIEDDNIVHVLPFRPSAIPGDTSSFRGALVKLTTDETVSNSSVLSIPWDVIEYDTDGFWSSGAATRLTIPAGSGITKVRISGGLEWTSVFAAGPRVTLLMQKNGLDFIGRALQDGPSVTNSAPHKNGISAAIDVVEGDYFEIQAFQNSGAPEDLLSGDGTWGSIEVLDTVETVSTAVPLASRGALLGMTSAEFFATGVEEDVDWGVALYDTDSFWASSPNPERLTIPIGSGITKVRLIGSNDWSDSATGYRRVIVRKNGASFDGQAQQSLGSGADPGWISFHSAPVDVEEGDYFVMACLQTSGSLSLLNTTGTWFAIEVVEAKGAVLRSDSIQLTGPLKLNDGFDSSTWPRWSVHKNGTDQTSVGTSAEIIEWSAVDFDEGANIDLSTTWDFTVPAGAGGIYSIDAQLFFDIVADGNLILVDIRVGGSVKKRSQQTVGATTTSSVLISTKIKLNVGDVVTIFGANGTSADTVSGAAIETWWSGSRIA